MAGSDGIDAAKRAWVTSVLGVTLPDTNVAAPGPSLVQLQKARLAWVGARKTIANELARLEGAILAAAAEDTRLAGIQSGVKRLGRILETLDDRLSDRLDDMLNADTQNRPKLSADARTLIADYNSFIAGDALMAEIDDNPFTPVRVRATAMQALGAISGQLAHFG